MSATLLIILFYRSYYDNYYDYDYFEAEFNDDDDD